MTDTDDLIKKVLELKEKNSDVVLRLYDRKHNRILNKDLTTKEIILISAIISGSGAKWSDLPLKDDNK